MYLNARTIFIWWTQCLFAWRTKCPLYMVEPGDRTALLSPLAGAVLEDGPTAAQHEAADALVLELALGDDLFAPVGVVGPPLGRSFDPRAVLALEALPLRLRYESEESIKRCAR